MNESNSDQWVQRGVSLATLALIGMVIWYIHESRLASGHQALVAGHAQNSMALAQVLQEASAYAQRDPSIIPVLNRLAGRNPSSSNAAPVRPGVPNPSANPNSNPNRR